MKKVSSSKYTKEFFLTRCEGWNYWQNEYQKLSPRLNYAVGLVGDGKCKRILDFGCGRGEVSLYFAQKGILVYAVDFASAAVEIVKKAVLNLPREIRKNIVVLKENVENLAIELESLDKLASLDTIFFLDVFEHLTDREIKIVLKKFFTFLRPGGKLIVHTAPNKIFFDVGYPRYTRWANMIINPFWKLFFNEKKPMVRKPREAFGSVAHINEQTPETVKNWLEAYGFKTRVWLDSRFHLVRIRDKINYFLLMPIWIPFLKKYFSWDIWAIGEKPK